jgi:hypothetical protein
MPYRPACARELSIMLNPLSCLIRHPTIVLFCLVLSSCFLLFYCRPAYPHDKPFNHPGNWGGTGLYETPNARVLDDGEMRFGYAYADPYHWYVMGFGVLPRVEFSMRYTQIDDIESGLGSDYGDYKDKAFDCKLQLIKESKQFPAVALGFHDINGTELFTAKYLAMSRQIYPLDFTIGVGSDRLKGPATLPFSDQLGLFGGIEWAINDRFSAVMEYNPIEYENDLQPTRAVPEGAASPINVGLRMQITAGLSMSLSYQRGDTLGIMGHLTFPLGKPILPKRSDPPDWRFLVHTVVPTLTPQAMVDGARADLEKTDKFADISVSIQGQRFIAEVSNDRYLSNTKAAGRVFRILLYYADPQIEKLVVRLSRRGIPVLSVSVAPQHLRAYLMGDLRQDLFEELLEISPAKRYPPTDQAVSASTQNFMRLREYGVKPDIKTFFNDPSGALKSRMSLQPFATLYPWTGGALVGRLDIPIYSDIGSINVPPPDAVRSDAWKYQGTTTALDQLMGDQVMKLSDRVYGRLSAGYLERMYTGISSEILAFIGDGRIALGMGGDWVKKREPETLTETQDFQSHTILGSIYYDYHPLNLTLQAQVGRFLAGDIGARFQITRRYDTGAKLGFWYSLTDTDHLTGFNKGYNDKGMFISIPLSTFSDFETRDQLSYSISPWTRDVGATVFHWQDLYNYGGDLTPARFKDEIDRFDD